MTFLLNRSIVLVGMMGSGKTSVGRMLAQKLDVPFVDSDEEIETASSYSIPELFQRFGEVYFREKETQVLLRLLKGGPIVLSTGGGAWMNHINRVNISDHGIAVWLKAEPNLLWARVKGRSHRPLLNVENPYETLKELTEMRGPIYAKAPVHVPVFSNHSVADTAKSVVRAVTEHGGIIERVDNAAQ